MINILAPFKIYKGTAAVPILLFMDNKKHWRIAFSKFVPFQADKYTVYCCWVSIVHQVFRDWWCQLIEVRVSVIPYCRQIGERPFMERRATTIRFKNIDDGINAILPGTVYAFNHCAARKVSLKFFFKSRCDIMNLIASILCNFLSANAGTCSMANTKYCNGVQGFGHNILFKKPAIIPIFCFDQLDRWYMFLATFFFHRKTTRKLSFQGCQIQNPVQPRKGSLNSSPNYVVGIMWEFGTAR